MKPLTTEELVWLYRAYQPKTIQYQGEKIKSDKFSILTESICFYETKDGMTLSVRWARPTDCRLILRSPSSLTEQELVELAVCMEATSIDEVYYDMDEDSDMMLVIYGEHGSSWVKFSDNLPLKAARFLFAKQINFLNLDSTIAVTE